MAVTRSINFECIKEHESERYTLSALWQDQSTITTSPSKDQTFAFPSKDQTHTTFMDYFSGVKKDCEAAQGKLTFARGRHTGAAPLRLLQKFQK
jgi:hypothetical protein